MIKHKNGVAVITRPRVVNGVIRTTTRFVWMQGDVGQAFRIIPRHQFQMFEYRSRRFNVCERQYIELHKNNNVLIESRKVRKDGNDTIQPDTMSCDELLFWYKHGLCKVS